MRARGSGPDWEALGAARSHPFRGRYVVVRIGPFAVAAVLAELSLLLPPGVSDTSAVLASGILLAATAVSIVLVPWGRLPRQAAVAVPILYCGSALALSLAAGGNSGIAVVVLIPLLWTALFHEMWESACVVAAIAASELVVSLLQNGFDATLYRRVVLWALLGVAISASVHGLRRRVRRAHQRTEELNERLRQSEVNDERLRIALGLQDEVIRRIFATTLTLHSAADMKKPTAEVIATAVGELDETLRVLRGTIFRLEHDRGDGQDASGDGMEQDASGDGMETAPGETSDPMSPPVSAP